MINTDRPKKLATKETIAAFHQASLRHKKLLYLSLLTPIGTVLLSVAAPFYASRVLAGIVQQQGDLSAPLTLLAASSLLGLLCNRIGFASAMAIGARVNSDLLKHVFERLLARGLSFHANRIGGKLVSDALDYARAYIDLVGSTLVVGLGFALSIIVGVILVWLNSWQLGIFITAVVAIILCWTAVNSLRRSQLRAKRLAALKALTSHLSDSIVNAQTVKMFASEAREIAAINKLSAKLEYLREKDWQMVGYSGNSRMGALLAMQFVMILFVIQLTRNDPSVLAAGIFAFTYTLTLSTRLFEINNLTRQIEEAFLNASPVIAMLKEKVEVVDKQDATELAVTDGGINLQNVSFAYGDNQQEVIFNGFNLSVRPGERVGLVGPSGGGKTTLTRLLLRFDDVTDGGIFIDNQNIADVTQTSLRQNVAFVPQEPLLFHRSIRENIAYGKPTADEEDIIRAAKRANAHDFIAALPNGYDTIVGERGVKLSGGQRQRVAIARAILKDAPILVLDEATSALDSENELQVQNALWHLMEGRTTIVIAHRLSTIQKMDRIVVLESGRITEEGTHKHLIHKNGTYARLWNHQSGGFIEE